MQHRYSRRWVLQALGLAVATAGTANFALEEREQAVARSVVSIPSLQSIKHILISCQENHSFDHYFGAYTSVYGLPAGWSQPDEKGGVVRPYHLITLKTRDIRHSWKDIH